MADARPLSPTRPAAPNGPIGLTSLIILTDPQSAAAEAYRSLSANIQFSGEGHARTIAVTSAGIGEGKSTTLGNLAVALAQSGHRVVVVDADLRRPGLHTLFGLDNREGLTNAVAANGSDIFVQETAVPGLRLLASGPVPASPSEIISSKHFESVLKALRTDADYVLVDAPPAGALSDAATIAARVDGVILVVSAGQARI